MELPEQFSERLSNVDVEVEDYPSPDDLRVARTRRGQTLLGLYRGTPQTRRGSGYNLVVPDRILILELTVTYDKAKNIYYYSKERWGDSTREEAAALLAGKEAR